MHLERQAEFGDISWTREWPAGALFTSAQPVPHGIGMGDQKISDPRIFESASDLRLSGGAKGTRTPDPHTASVVRYQLRHSPGCCAHRSYTTVCQPSKSLVTRPA
jgi:hypothetical protein